MRTSTKNWGYLSIYLSLDRSKSHIWFTLFKPSRQLSEPPRTHRPRCCYPYSNNNIKLSSDSAIIHWFKDCPRIGKLLQFWDTIGRRWCYRRDLLLTVLRVPPYLGFRWQWNRERRGVWNEALWTCTQIQTRMTPTLTQPQKRSQDSEVFSWTSRMKNFQRRKWGKANPIGWWTYFPHEASNGMRDENKYLGIMSFPFEDDLRYQNKRLFLFDCEFCAKKLVTTWSCIQIFDTPAYMESRIGFLKTTNW